MNPEPNTAVSAHASELSGASTARLVLAVFVVTFMLARILVFLIMSRRVPDLYMHLGGTHVHHLNYGIFFLSAVGAYLLFQRPTGRAHKTAAVVYAIGMALTFDEFGMWLHLGGSYWQRASWDAVTVVAALLALVAFAPGIKRWRHRHVGTGILTVLLAAVFFSLLYKSFQYAGQEFGHTVHEIESASPQ